MLPTDYVYLFGNDDDGDALFNAAFSNISIHRRLRLLLDPATNEQSSVQRGTALITKSCRVGLSLRYAVQGTAAVDITRSSMDAPFMMARYAESILQYAMKNECVLVCTIRLHYYC